MPRILIPQPKWMRNVRVGDVLKSGDGVLRVVRAVSYYDEHRRNRGSPILPPGYPRRLRSVHLTIRRCSWTHRCYTILGYNDLRLRGFRRVGHINLKKRGIDKEIEKNLHILDRTLDCCDVRGIP